MTLEHDATVVGRVPAPPGGPRVLVVDDRPENLRALELVLQPLGVSVLFAESGAEALRLLLHESVAVVILDVHMPDMDGFETAALLRSRQATRLVPIVFLTAAGPSLEYEVRSYEAGGVGYITKPFAPEVLRAKIRSLLHWSEDLRALGESARLYEESGAALEQARRDGGDPTAAAADAMAGDLDGAMAFSQRVRVLDLELAADLRAPSAARSAVRAALAGHDSDLADTVVLLVSELVTNAVLHARSTTRIRLDLGGSALRVEIDDVGGRLPAPLAPALLDENGRGLRMVAQLTARSGCTDFAGGKSIWFEADLPEPNASP